jgi:hypothetical protein
MNPIDEARQWVDWYGLDEQHGEQYAVIRISLVRDLLQELDTCVQQARQNLPQSLSGVGDAITSKEPKPCPFCGLSLYYDAPSRQWIHPDVDDCVLWRFKFSNEDVSLWNGRAPEPGTPDELSDVERQEAGYPATRAYLICALRDAEDTLTNNGICSGGVNNPYADELGEIRERIRDILSREEP